MEGRSLLVIGESPCLKKFQSSLTYWTKNGGALPEKVVRELEDTDLQFENLGNPKNNRNYKQEHKVIRFKKYPDDVPIKNFRLVPSYKRMCITILKNGKTMQIGLAFGHDLEARRIQFYILKSSF